MNKRSLIKPSFILVGILATFTAWAVETPPAAAGKAAVGVPVADHNTPIRAPRVDKMSNCPEGFLVPDWRQMARDYADLVFDLDAKGECMPLVWIDKSHINYPEDTFGLYVVVGDPRGGPNQVGGANHIAYNDIPAVISSSLVGLDMRDYKGRNWVRMCRAFFNKANGRNVFMELSRELDAHKVGGGYNTDFWIDTLPSLLAMELGGCYPQEGTLDEPLRTSADRFLEASRILLATPEKFAWGTFDWLAMKPVKKGMSGILQADAAGGFGTLLYWAHKRFGDPKYLDAALRCLDELNAQKQNPAYDCMMSYGFYASVRANAEQQRDYDVAKLLNWASSRGIPNGAAHGFATGKWGEHDVSGLMLVCLKNRAYQMETYIAVKMLVPTVRYDARLADAIGKWMQNVASHARYFYPAYLPKDHQACPELGATRGVIGSEALTSESLWRKECRPGGYLNSYPIPFAERDQWEHFMKLYNPDGTISVFPKAAHHSLYSSSHMGVLGGIVARTADEKILRLDLLKTDFYHDKAYPTYLYYNPDDVDKDLTIDVGPEPVDLYNTVTHAFVKRGVKGLTSVLLPKAAGTVLVLAPAGGRESRQGRKFLVNDVVVDFRAKGTTHE